MLSPQLVVATLIRMAPSLSHGMLVLLLVWLLFSVAGVHAFAGKFYYCFNETSGEIFSSEVVENKTQCFDLNVSNYSEVRWKRQPLTYDSVMEGYLSLLILVRVCNANGRGAGAGGHSPTFLCCFSIRRFQKAGLGSCMRQRIPDW